MSRRIFAIAAVAITLSLQLPGCADELLPPKPEDPAQDGTEPPPDDTPQVEKYTIGGAILGYTGSNLHLRLNTNTPQEIRSGESVYQFITSAIGDNVDERPLLLDENTAYVITISTQPDGNSCNVNNYTGIVTEDVVSANVTCTPLRYNLSGSVIGLVHGPLDLELVADTETRRISVEPETTAFTIPGAIFHGSDYSLQPTNDPPGHNCTLIAGSPTGTATGPVSGIIYGCPETIYTIAGAITGQTSGLQARVTYGSASQTEAIATLDTSYEFPGPFVYGSAYIFDFPSYPAGQTCSISPKLGLITTNINPSIACSTLQFTISGAVTGHTAPFSIRLGGETLNIAVGQTAYTFSTEITSGSAYTVELLNQPPTGFCALSNAQGTIFDDITDANISCAATQATKLFAGGDSTCVVLNNGYTKCWGANTYGQLGYPHVNDIGLTTTSINNLGPVPMEPGTEPLDIALSDTHACFLSDLNELRCLGFNNKGQLGTGDTTNRGGIPSQSLNDIAPIALPHVDAHPIATATSRGLSCARADNQTVFCWGDNSTTFRLGLDNNTPLSLVPVAPHVHPNLLPLTSISANATHVCSITAAQGVQCWGANALGQTGTPPPVTVLACGSTEDRNITVTTPVIQPITTDYNNALCDRILGTVWDYVTGTRTTSQLGNCSFDCQVTARLTCRRCIATTVSNNFFFGDQTDELYNKTVPSLGSGFSPTQVTTGFNFTCIRSTLGFVKCFGYNLYGQLGLGDTANRGDQANEMGASLTTLNLGNNIQASQLTTGYEHSCIITQTGNVRCWGRNQYGQLGYGDQTERGSTAATMGSALANVNLGTGRTATAIAAGNHHTCALLDNGEVKCWGRNHRGQLGYGDNTTRGVAPNQMGTNLPYVNF